MTLAITHVGEGANTTGSGGTSQWSFQCGDSFAVYDYIVVCVASDNAGTGGADSVSSVTDQRSNSYSEIVQMLKSNASTANDSGSCSIWMAQVTTSMSSTDLIYVNQSPNTNRGAAVAHKITVGSTSYVTVPATGTNDGFSSGPSAWAVGTVAAGDGIIVAVAAEYNTTPNSIDTDSNGGATWCSPSHSNFSNSGTTTSSQAIGTQHKVCTSAVAQTFSLSYAASCDWEACYAHFHESAAATPSAPTLSSVTANAVGGFQLSFTNPGTPAGGRPVTDFYIQYSTDNSNWSNYGYVGGTSSPKNVTGFSNGTLYYFRIAAVNAIGTGTYSSSVSATSWAVPGAPTSLACGTPTETTMPLTWIAPASNGGTAITDYVVQYALAGSGSWSTFSDGTSTTPSATVTGLTPGVNYDFRVAAVNAVGTGSYSSTATKATLSNGEGWGIICG